MARLPKRLKVVRAARPRQALSEHLEARVLRARSCRRPGSGPQARNGRAYWLQKPLNIYAEQYR